MSFPCFLNVVGIGCDLYCIGRDGGGGHSLCQPFAMLLMPIQHWVWNCDSIQIVAFNSFVLTSAEHIQALKVCDLQIWYVWLQKIFTEMN
jgi:hypothetical protein